MIFLTLKSSYAQSEIQGFKFPFFPAFGCHKNNKQTNKPFEIQEAIDKVFFRILRIVCVLRKPPSRLTWNLKENVKKENVFD